MGKEAEISRHKVILKSGGIKCHRFLCTIVVLKLPYVNLVLKVLDNSHNIVYYSSIKSNEGQTKY